MEPVTQMGRVWPKSFASTGLALIFSAGALLAQQAIPLRGDISPIHDPTIAREGSNYYVFSTNRYRQKDLPEFCSPDLHTFTFCGSIFDDVPAWARTEIPGAKDIWAPDVKYVDGVYRVYYAVSTFGSNVSDIGLAFGSFWSGIKMRRVNPATGKLSAKDKKLYSLASRPRSQGHPGAIEAPYIVGHGRYYYLFVSFDQCCKGAQSTYRTMVGRAEKITGPYKDKNGRSMMDGNATELLAGNDRWKGPGGQSVLEDGDRDLLVFHAYGAEDGRRTLQISTLTWDNDCPHAALETRQP